MCRVYVCVYKKRPNHFPERLYLHLSTSNGRVAQSLHTFFSIWCCHCLILLWRGHCGSSLHARDGQAHLKRCALCTLISKMCVMALARFQNCLCIAVALLVLLLGFGSSLLLYFGVTGSLKPSSRLALKFSWCLVLIHTSIRALKT